MGRYPQVGWRNVPNQSHRRFLPFACVTLYFSHLLQLARPLEPDDGFSTAPSSKQFEELVECVVGRGEHREGAALVVQPHVQTNLDKMNLEYY